MKSLIVATALILVLGCPMYSEDAPVKSGSIVVWNKVKSSRPTVTCRGAQPVKIRNNEYATLALSAGTNECKARYPGGGSAYQLFEIPSDKVVYLRLVLTSHFFGGVRFEATTIEEFQADKKLRPLEKD